MKRQRQSVMTLCRCFAGMREYALGGYYSA